jgi:hypothetical protein
MLRLPLIFLPFLAGQIQQNEESNFKIVSLMSLFHAWISGASILNYLSKFRFYNQMVLESKPLPLFSDVYHIEFSLILAMIGLLGLHELLKNKAPVFWKMMLLSGTVINILFLHLLSARTGILAFWAGLASLALLKILQDRKKIYPVLFSALLLLAASMMLPTIRNRIFNTIEDVSAVVKGDNLYNKSLGQRWEAWSACIAAIKNETATGYGISSVDVAVKNAYHRAENQSEPTNWIMPHNQILDISIQSGILAGLIYFIFLLSLAISAFKSHNGMLLAFSLGILLAGMFESILERQAGVIVFIFALSYAWKQDIDKKTEKIPERVLN